MSVSIALAADTTKFMKLAEPALTFDGAASRLRLVARDGGVLDNGAGVRAKGVTAVRFEFRDGPVGFNVYREIQVIGQASSP